MFMKRIPHRIFDYEPRFYKPEEDEKKAKEDKKAKDKHRRLCGLCLLL